MLSDTSDASIVFSEDDGGEYVPASTAKPSPKKSASSSKCEKGPEKPYQLKNSLRPPRVATYSAQALYGDYISHSLV